MQSNLYSSSLWSARGTTKIGLVEASWLLSTSSVLCWVGKISWCRFERQNSAHFRFQRSSVALSWYDACQLHELASIIPALIDTRSLKMNTSYDLNGKDHFQCPEREWPSLMLQEILVGMWMWFFGNLGFWTRPGVVTKKSSALKNLRNRQYSSRAFQKIKNYRNPFTDKKVTAPQSWRLFGKSQMSPDFRTVNPGFCSKNCPTSWKSLGFYSLSVFSDCV